MTCRKVFWVVIVYNNKTGKTFGNTLTTHYNISAAPGTAIQLPKTATHSTLFYGSVGWCFSKRLYFICWPVGLYGEISFFPSFSYISYGTCAMSTLDKYWWSSSWAMIWSEPRARFENLTKKERDRHSPIWTKQSSSMKLALYIFKWLLWNSADELMSRSSSDLFSL